MYCQPTGWSGVRGRPSSVLVGRDRHQLLREKRSIRLLLFSLTEKSPLSLFCSLGLVFRRSQPRKESVKKYFWHSITFRPFPVCFISCQHDLACFFGCLCYDFWARWRQHHHNFVRQTSTRQNYFGTLCVSFLIHLICLLKKAPDYRNYLTAVQSCPILTRCPSLLRPWWTGSEPPFVPMY